MRIGRAIEFGLSYFNAVMFIVPIKIIIYIYTLSECFMAII